VSVGGAFVLVSSRSIIRNFMVSREAPIALITGGSAGLGVHIAASFLQDGYRVILVGRDGERLRAAVDRLSPSPDTVLAEACDLTKSAEVAALFERLADNPGRLDVLVNCVGSSDRGLIETLKPEKLNELIQQNVVTALLCSQFALPMLEASGGVIVNIGSLASKVGARYIGGYAIAKHALAGMTQQMRLELKSRGVHVGLVSPGPIRRDDAGRRYDTSDDPSLPAQAAKPGGGTNIKGLPPERVADAVMKMVRRRTPDIVMPGYLRILIAIGHASPRLGDWLLLKFTSDKG
jgi:NAD(P)-dependent dehydrogenase (short-subunit alcohol dehydrogenase family)